MGSTAMGQDVAPNALVTATPPSAGGGPWVDATEAVGTEARRTMVGSEASCTQEVCGTSATAAPGGASARRGERAVGSTDGAGRGPHAHAMGEADATGALDAADHADG